MHAISDAKFTSGERIIATIIAIASFASVFSILLLLARVAVAAIRPLVHGLKGRRESRGVLFFQTQVGSYVACLLLANLLSGIAGLIDFSWAGRGGIVAGPECTAQGILIQIGDFAGAYFTVVIAMHTVQTLVMHKRLPPWVVIVGITFGWGSSVALGTALTTIASPIHGPFFNSVGMWCAISSGYTIEQFVVYYLPIIISAFVTSALYAVLFLCLRGTLVIGDGIKLNLAPENVQGWAGRLSGREEYKHFLGTIVKSLLWYPFAFIVLFLPITVAGLMRISGIHDSDALLAVAGVSASLLGLANVLILYNTLRIFRQAINSQTRSTDSESFFVPEERKPEPEPTIVTHGRAFPPPVSRAGSPLSGTGSSYRRSRPLPQPRSGERSEHAPTPQMIQDWLRHQRSSSSVDSMAHLLHASSTTGRPGHSRNASSSTSSENIHAPVCEPIDADLSQTNSLNRTISVMRSTTPASVSGLPPPPRPARGESLFSLDNVSAVPPVPPVPSRSRHAEPDVPSNSRYHAEHDFVDVDLKSSGHKNPKTSQTTLIVPSARTSTSFEHEDYEIHRVDSRELLRPAISAVARAPFPARQRQQYDAPANSKDALASVVSLPESVSVSGDGDRDSLASSMREDSLYRELRLRTDSDAREDEGSLSAIAWASLVAHAAVRDRLESESTFRSPAESESGTDEDVSPPQRRLSDIPILLRPGAPGSAAADMYFSFGATMPEKGQDVCSVRGFQQMLSLSGDDVAPRPAIADGPLREMGTYRR